MADLDALAEQLAGRFVVQVEVDDGRYRTNVFRNAGAAERAVKRAADRGKHAHATLVRLVPVNVVTFAGRGQSAPESPEVLPEVPVPSASTVSDHVQNHPRWWPQQKALDDAAADRETRALGYAVLRTLTAAQLRHLLWVGLTESGHRQVYAELAARSEQR